MQRMGLRTSLHFLAQLELLISNADVVAQTALHFVETDFSNELPQLRQARLVSRPRQRIGELPIGCQEIVKCCGTDGSFPRVSRAMPCNSSTSSPCLAEVWWAPRRVLKTLTCM